MKKGWEMKTIGDVCDKASSNVSQNQLGDDNGKYPIFGASGLIKNVSFYHQEKPYLSIVKDGSGVGRVTKMEAYTSVIGTLQYILPKENIDLNYLHYSLMSVDFKKYVAGAAIPHIYFKDYKEEPFLWMPLPEQQRIVAILDESFAAINKAKQNAERNLQNAKELFESYLSLVFERDNKGWDEKAIGEVCDLVDSLHKTPKYINNGGFPMVRVTEIKYGDLDISGALRVDNEIYKEFSKKHIPKIGDIVFSRVGASFGVSSLVISNEPFCLGQNTVFIIPKLNSHYCYYFLNSKVARGQMNKLVAGAAQPTISLKSIKELVIPIPPSNQVQQIVQKIKILSAKCKKLETIYRQKINDLEELKKSILQKAFNGELKTKEVEV